MSTTSAPRRQDVLFQKTDWDPWFAYTKIIAECCFVWDDVDPFVDKEDLPREVPKYPMIQDVNKENTSRDELTEEEEHAYNCLMMYYYHKKELYSSKTIRLMEFEEHLFRTVSTDALIPLILQKPRLSLSSIMKTLKAQFCPSAEERVKHG